MSKSTGSGRVYPLIWICILRDVKATHHELILIYAIQQVRRLMNRTICRSRMCRNTYGRARLKRWYASSGIWAICRELIKFRHCSAVKEFRWDLLPLWREYWDRLIRLLVIKKTHVALEFLIVWIVIVADVQSGEDFNLNFEKYSALRNLQTPCSACCIASSGISPFRLRFPVPLPPLLCGVSSIFYLHDVPETVYYSINFFLCVIDGKAFW